MTRTRRTLALTLITGLLVAACGGSGATTAPGATAAPGGTTPASSQAAPTEAAVTPVASQDGGGDGTGITGAAKALEDLTSYKFKILMAAEGKGDFMLVKAGGSLEMAGTIILKPAPAMDMTMTTTDETGAASAIGWRILDGKAYMSFGPDSWMETSADDAQSTIDSFKPESLMSGFGDSEDMENVGDETKNGIDCTHMKGSAPAMVGSMFGLPTGSWTIEAWIAKDGGFLVSSALVGEANDGKFTMAMDILDLDSSSNVVEAPASFTPMTP